MVAGIPCRQQNFVRSKLLEQAKKVGDDDIADAEHSQL